MYSRRISTGAGAILVLGVLCVVARADLNQGLIAHWKFDEGSGIHAGDSAGGHTGTIYGGAAWVAGVSGPALDFNGSTAYVQVPDAEAFSFGNGTHDAAFTLAAWVKHRGDSAVPDDIVSKYAWPGFENEYMFRVNPGNTLSVFLFDATNDYRLGIMTDTELDSNWRFVTATYDGSGTIAGLKLFIDGAQQATTIVFNNPSYVAMHNTTAPVEIACGRRAGDQWDEYLTGAIDEVRMYDRALSADEVHELYVPEPSALALLAVPALGAMRRRR